MLFRSKPSNLNIIQVTATSDSSAFDFSINTSLRSGDSVILCFYNLQDQANNRTDSICDTMIYIQLEHPLAGDIVINEIMCNPNGANYLPNVEYIELYNNSSNYLSTSSMTLSDPSTIGVLPDDTMPPKSYKVYANSSGKTLLESYGVKAIALSNFPSLNNDGDCIKLKYQNIVLDELSYDDTFYQDAFKNAGGWSIEKIQPEILCQSKDNWKASCNNDGGTPNKLNCVDGFFVDQRAPLLKNVFVSDLNTIELNFSEQVNVAGVSANDFLIDESYHPDSIIYNNNPTTKLQLKASILLQANEVHHLSVPSIDDCAGNKLTEESKKVSFGLGIHAQKGG